ncbi:MAG: serine hydrolase domain-containing protein [Trueperella sp.]|nr:serine hydrolase domain-containing protein [Trueperella sp.]
MEFSALPADTFGFPHAYVVLTAQNPVCFYGDLDRVFPLASVTKPIAAWAVLVAVAQGKLTLDDAAGPAGATVRHLLSHAAGLPYTAGEPINHPGERRGYSNYGFDLVADILAERTGMSAPEWIKQTVAQPLGMDTLEISGSIAHTGQASADCLALFAAEVLNPTLIPAELAEEALSPVFPGLPGVLPGYGPQSDNLWGLGFEIRGHKSPHWLGEDFPPETAGHFGQSGSFIWIDRQAQKAGVFLGAEPFGTQHREIWPALTNQMRAL